MRCIWANAATKAATALAVALLAPAVAAAQAWPQKPVKMIVPFPAGGGTDFIGRLAAKHLTDRLGQQVFVENRAGALTKIAAQYVAHAKPDGYTVFVTAGNSTFAANPWLFKDLPYDPVKDFTPVTSLLKTPFLFAVPQGSPINSVAELTAALKAIGYKQDVVIERGEVRKPKKAPSRKFRDEFGHMSLSIKEEILWKC